MQELLRRIAYWWRQAQRDAELAEEIAAHRAMAVDAHRADGSSPGEAAMRAAREMGNAPLARDRARDVWVAPWLQDVDRDLRIAARRLWAERGFTAAAIMTLALGIGANTTVFTIVNAINWRGLPVDEPDRIVTVSVLELSGPAGVSLSELREWQGATQTFVGLGGVRSARFNLRDGAGDGAGDSSGAGNGGGGKAGTSDGNGNTRVASERTSGVYVSWNMFHLLGDKPLVGRAFVESDDRPGAEPVMLIGYRVWRDRYGASPAVIGRHVTIDDRPTTIVGVMPEGFGFPALAEAWMPLSLAPGILSGDLPVRVVGRLAPSTSPTEAAAEMTAVAARTSAGDAGPSSDRRIVVEPFTGRADEPFLYALFAAVALVLLVACANVASLLLARAAARAREAALCSMLGASRWRVVRQLLAESLLMAVMAGGMGLLIARAGVQFFVGDTNPTSLAYWVQWTMDGRVFGFLALASAAALVLFGVAPAVVLARGADTAALTAGRRATTGRARTRQATSLLLVGEFALTLVLLTGAGLMVQSLRAMQARDRVIETSAIVASSLSPSPEKYPTPQARAALLDSFDARFAAVPALTHAALATNAPFSGVSPRGLNVEGRVRPAGQERRVGTVGIGDGYFDALGIHVIEGRTFTSRDGTAGHGVAIVNSALASRQFPGASAVGRRLRLQTPGSNTPSEWMTVVGVAPTVRQQPQRQDLEEVVYLPLRAAVRDGLPGSLALLVRTESDARSIAAVLRDELGRVDSDLALSDIAPLTRIERQSRWTHRLLSRMLTAFAGIALVMSVVGLYAATAYAVRQRTQEVGVRVALGARGLDVVRLFMRGTARRLVAGVVLGAIGAAGLGALLRGLVVDTGVADPRVVATVAGLLAAAAIASTVVPLRRAVGVDPVVALRHE